MLYCSKCIMTTYTVYYLADTTYLFPRFVILFQYGHKYVTCETQYDNNKARYNDSRPTCYVAMVTAPPQRGFCSRASVWRQIKIRRLP